VHRQQGSRGARRSATTSVGSIVEPSLSQALIAPAGSKPVVGRSAQSGFVGAVACLLGGCLALPGGAEPVGGTTWEGQPCTLMGCGPNFVARFKVRADADAMTSLGVKVCQNDACTVADVGAKLARWPSWKLTVVVAEGPLRVDIDNYSIKMGACAPECEVVVTYGSQSRNSDVWDVSLTVAGGPAAITRST